VRCVRRLTYSTGNCARAVHAAYGVTAFEHDHAVCADETGRSALCMQQQGSPMERHIQTLFPLLKVSVVQEKRSHVHNAMSYTFNSRFEGTVSCKWSEKCTTLRYGHGFVFRSFGAPIDLI
jgi:hypothetical protein